MSLDATSYPMLVPFRSNPNPLPDHMRSSSTSNNDNINNNTRSKMVELKKTHNNTNHNKEENSKKKTKKSKCMLYSLIRNHNNMISSSSSSSSSTSSTNKILSYISNDPSCVLQVNNVGWTPIHLAIYHQLPIQLLEQIFVILQQEQCQEQENDNLTARMVNNYNKNTNTTKKDLVKQLLSTAVPSGNRLPLHFAARFSNSLPLFELLVELYPRALLAKSENATQTSAAGMSNNSNDDTNHETSTCCDDDENKNNNKNNSSNNELDTYKRMMMIKKQQQQKQKATSNNNSIGLTPLERARLNRKSYDIIQFLEKETKKEYEKYIIEQKTLLLRREVFYCLCVQWNNYKRYNNTKLLKNSAVNDDENKTNNKKMTTNESLLLFDKDTKFVLNVYGWFYERDMTEVFQELVLSYVGLPKTTTATSITN